MSEASSQAASLRIDTLPDKQRQAKLEASYQQNVAHDKPPYAGVKIVTYGELLWVFQQRQWSGEFDFVQIDGIPEGRQRPNLSRAILRRANLSGANLYQANLNEAKLDEATLNGVVLREATLNGVVLMGANLSGADLERTDLSGANLYQADLSKANLREATLNGAVLQEATLSEASFREANLSGANLLGANLMKATLMHTNLSGATLVLANLSGAFLYQANLSGANLLSAKFDSDTSLTKIILSLATVLRDIRWNGVDITGIEWQQLSRLGDDFDSKATPDDKARANRQLATILRAQGMNEVADRFAYQAQLWQRRIIRQRLSWTNLRSLGPYFGSLLLWAVSGYGYRPSRTFVAYLLTVGSFAAAYYAVTHTVETQLAKLSWDEALVLSLTSFHGRGFLPGFLALGDWVARIGALEAVIGLFIELILIATFSRRFLGN